MEPSRQCVVLVGGLGTRLGEITRDTPKPLLAVDGQPFLAHLIRNGLRFGFDDFVLLAGFNASKIEAFASAIRQELPIRVRVVAEPEPAGTGGALVYARELLEGEFLMLNGDSMFDFNWLDLGVRSVQANWTARIALREVDDSSRFGSIDLEGESISAFREKAECAAPGLINTGVYWLKRAILDEIRVLPYSLEHDVFPALVKRKQALGFTYAGAFIDIGIPDDLARARNEWKEMRRKPAVFFDRDGILNYDSGYTHRIEDFHWKPGAREAILHCNDAGWLTFVVTNQAGIARGYYEAEAVDALHRWMNADLRCIGAHIDDFRFCPHHPDGVLSAFSVHCECRKPRPGMIRSLAAEWPIDGLTSFLVGDKPSDILAAQAAGLTGHLLDRDADLLTLCKALVSSANCADNPAAARLAG
jgi:D,D-heptose 1,7-bisphosphate phosphatase